MISQILGALLAIGTVTSSALPFSQYLSKQRAIAFQNGSQQANKQKNPEPLFYEPDLTELVLLAGSADHDMSLSDEGLKALGWERGVEIIDVSNKTTCFFDHALTYKKQSHCIAAFSATDDHEDALEMAVPLTQEFCGFHINAGLASEIVTYMQTPNWARFLEYFTQPECETVTAIGHSSGGAVASVFAACANIGHAGFGSRMDFGLTTFGAFPPSVEPLFSGSPSTPFRGTRYLVSGLDGGVNSRDSMPINTKQLRLDILEFYLRSIELVGPENATEGLNEMFEAVSNIPETDVETFWNDNAIWTKLVALGLDLKLIYLGYPEKPEHLELQPLMHVLLKKLVSRGDTSFMYDPVGAQFDHLGYVHPLVDYQPISNHLVGNVPLRRVSAPDAIKLPQIDPILSAIGTMLNVKPPNHQTCCYFQGRNCLWHYSNKVARQFKGCIITVSR